MIATDQLLQLEAQMGIIGRRMRRAVAERAAAIHPSLGAVGYSVLDQLQRCGTSRQTDLVGVLGSEKGAISRAVQQLVDLGLAVRVADPEDRRAHLVALTDLGAARLGEVVAERRAAFAERLGEWSPAQLDEFVSALTRYNAALEARR